MGNKNEKIKIFFGYLRIENVYSDKETNTRFRVFVVNATHSVFFVGEDYFLNSRKHVC